MKTTKNKAIKVDAKGLKIGVAVAEFNSAITEKMLAECADELTRCGVEKSDIVVFRVPGALEIPFALLHLASKNEVDAAVGIGCVIRGDTYHFEIVANESARGIMQAQLQCGVPFANGILTVENESQAQARISKGAEAANAALQMATLHRRDGLWK